MKIFFLIVFVTSSVFAQTYPDIITDESDLLSDEQLQSVKERFVIAGGSVEVCEGYMPPFNGRMNINDFLINLPLMIKAFKHRSREEYTLYSGTISDYRLYTVWVYPSGASIHYLRSTQTAVLEIGTCE